MFSRATPRFLALTSLLCIALSLILLVSRNAAGATDPWTPAQTVQPTELLKELADSKSAPTVVFVGFQRLFGAGHIKGAQYHGSGGNPDGLAQLKAWAASLPRSTNLVIYCGCCPLERCPNLRPAFAALRDMGFTKLRVLILPTDFAVDWAGKGYAYDKGQ
jgi:thiosulfate/3-mercaptopyruvate sulfurtransferase